MDLPENFFQISILVALWTLPWKGLALWKAAKQNHITWFIVLMIINSLAILEIIYLFLIPPRTKFSFNWGKTKPKKNLEKDQK